MKLLRIVLPGAWACVALAGFPNTGRTQTTAARLSGSVVGFTTGSPLDRRPLVPVTAYSSSTWVPGMYGSIYSPIFMTSLNYPGTYGFYSIGVAPLTLNREPFAYPQINPREIIPSVTTTVAPLRTPTTPAGAATMTTAPPSVVPAVPGTTALRTTFSPQTPAVPAGVETPGESARLIIRVPENAYLDVGGTAVVGQGTADVRRFVTPPLEPGKVYHYDIQARWTDGGQQIVRDKHVQFQAGERVDIDFLAPAATETERALKAQPGMPVPSTPPLKPTLPPRRP